MQGETANDGWQGSGGIMTRWGRRAFPLKKIFYRKSELNAFLFWQTCKTCFSFCSFFTWLKGDGCVGFSETFFWFLRPARREWKRTVAADLSGHAVLGDFPYYIDPQVRPCTSIVLLVFSARTAVGAVVAAENTPSSWSKVAEVLLTSLVVPFEGTVQICIPLCL